MTVELAGKAYLSRVGGVLFTFQEIRMPRFRTAAAAALAATALLLAGCATGTTSADTDAETTVGANPADPSAFPVTVEHAFGETTISEKPERIATIAWANHEVPLALGVVPVGMTEVTWGDDDANGVLPWVEDKLEELGAETPVLFDEADGIDFEAVADTDPDVILASYSGLTQEDYDTLSKIAPVVAYPEVAWGTSYEDMIRLNSTAIGLAAEGEALIDDLHAQVDDALAEFPELADTSVIFAFPDASDLSTIGFYTSHDTRPGFLASIGLPVPTVVEEESASTDSFLAEVSAEAADRFEDVDIFVVYGDGTGAITEAMQADPLYSQIPAIAAGHVAELVTGPLAASANPSPLSIPWGINDYFALIAGALAGE